MSKTMSEQVRSPIFVRLIRAAGANHVWVSKQIAGVRLPLRDSRDDSDRPASPLACAWPPNRYPQKSHVNCSRASIPLQFHR
jgi:hypothetical protein